MRSTSTISSEGEYGNEGYLKEYLGVGSVMFDLQHRDEISKLGWDDIGGNTFAGGEETHRVWPKQDAHDTSQNSDQVSTELGKSFASFRVPFTDLNYL
jgi:hypothetical protein